jgi:DNA repair protein RecO (recombination protein O)
MQPFCPILVALGGQSELKYLSSAETAGVAISLPGERLFSGFYMNELLVRLLPKWDSVPQLFASYGASLVELSEQADLDLTLRRFEIVLFEELGYEIQWATDHRGQRIKAECSYLFVPDRGFVERDQSESEGLLSGAALIKLNSWCRERTAVDEGARRVLKKMMRQAIDYRLDGRPLMVREAFGQWRGLSQPKGDE